MRPVLEEALFDVWWEWRSIDRLANVFELILRPLKVGVRAKRCR
jgi:hypothetical protein